MIDAIDVSFAYGRRPPLLDGFSWSVPAGEAWAIIGPSGCGKTTLLYLLAGLRQPISGSIRIAGRPVDRPRPRTGLVLQDHGLLPWATVRENVRLGLAIRKFYGPDGRHAPADGILNPASVTRQLDDWIRRLGIADLQDQYPGQLSRGQRQRTAIARTLALEPDLLLLDEPFSALDAPTREDLQQLVITLGNERGMTVVIVTHDIEVAVTMGSKILVLGPPASGVCRVIPNHWSADGCRHPGVDFDRMCATLRRQLEVLR